MQTFLHVGHSRSLLPALHLNSLPLRTTVQQVWTVSEIGRVDEDDCKITIFVTFLSLTAREEEKALLLAYGEEI